jgi:putative ABC transport system ATP-binding protein
MALPLTTAQRKSASARSSVPIVRLRNLSKAYEEAGVQRTILQALDADLYTGDFIVLLGKSGSGKSTLLNLIGGIDVPSSGEIWINDTNLTALNERALTLFRRDHIGFVFQFFNLIPTLTALENVSLPFELQGKPRRHSEQRARALLGRVGLAHRADAYPDRLSGGEQQRVAIARTLAAQPQIILADEPTGQLDSQTGRRILDLLRRLVNERGMTLAVVSHDPMVMAEADVVHELRDGKLIETRYKSA